MIDPQRNLFDIEPPPRLEPPGTPFTGRRISEPVMALLAGAKVEGMTLLPMPPVDRETYEELADVLGRLRGKWKRGVGHVFPYDPSLALRAVLATGVFPANNPHAYFPTPDKIAAGLVHGVDKEWWPRGDWETRTMRALEPSAGWGSIADAMRERWRQAEIVCVEIDPLNASTLRQKGYTVLEQDFLAYRPAELFDVVVGNPPFAVDGDPIAWLSHLKHAWTLLRDGGCLGWVMPAGTWTTSSRRIFAEFREWLLDNGADLNRHDDEAFKASGTTIRTMDIVVGKYERVMDPNQDPTGMSHSYDAEVVMVDIECRQEWAERGQALEARELPPEHPEVVRFIRESIAFVNGIEDGGIARSPTLIAELQKLWPGWC